MLIGKVALDLLGFQIQANFGVKVAAKVSESNGNKTMNVSSCQKPPKLGIFSSQGIRGQKSTIFFKTSAVFAYSYFDVSGKVSSCESDGWCRHNGMQMLFGYGNVLC